MKPAGQVIGPLAGKPGIELRVGSASKFLVLELSGTVVPVVDLLGETVLHGGVRIFDHLFLTLAHLVQVLRDQMNRGMLHGERFKILAEPTRRIKVRKGNPFRLGHGTIVEIRRRTGSLRFTVGWHFDELHSFEERGRSEDRRLGFMSR